MDVKVISKNKNPLLKRQEVHFQVEHTETGSTPPRLETRKAVAKALKKDVDLVFVKKLETKTGTHTAVGLANVYDSVEQAKFVEPEYIIKRNVPPEKPEEEKRE
jgi:small subunit ribosomal protein S24e